MRVLDPDGVLSGCKIYIGLGKTSLLPVFGGSRYRHIVARSRGYKLAREGKDPKSLRVVLLRVLCIECSLSGFLPPSRHTDPSPFIDQGGGTYRWLLSEGIVVKWFSLGKHILVCHCLFRITLHRLLVKRVDDGSASVIMTPSVSRRFLTFIAYPSILPSSSCM
jgi:hypothetical protein